MIYFIIGAIMVLLFTFTQVGDEMLEGIERLETYVALKSNNGDSLEALKDLKESDERIDKKLNEKLGGIESPKALAWAILTMMLLWPLYIIIYLLSLKFHA